MLYLFGLFWINSYWFFFLSFLEAIHNLYLLMDVGVMFWKYRTYSSIPNFLQFFFCFSPIFSSSESKVDEGPFLLLPITWFSIVTHHVGAVIFGRIRAYLFLWAYRKVALVYCWFFLTTCPFFSFHKSFWTLSSPLPTFPSSFGWFFIAHFRKEPLVYLPSYRCWVLFFLRHS